MYAGGDVKKKREAGYIKRKDEVVMINIDVFFFFFKQKTAYEI